MSQFHIYKNKNKATQENYPFLLEVQSNLLNDIRTTVVIPMMPKRVAGSLEMSKLNPVVRIKSGNYITMTQNLSSIDRSDLGEMAGDLNKHRSDFMSAIDFLITGI